MANKLVELWLKVPQTNKWDPGRAEGMIKQLINDVDYLALYIIARADSIRWSLALNPRYQRPVEDTLYAFYPDIQIDAQPLAGDQVYSFVELALGNLSLFPLMYASDLKQLDPLAPMINAMAGLRPGEEIVYSLKLSFPKKNYYRELKRLTTPSIGRSIWEGVKADLGGMIGIGPRRMSAEEMQREQTARGLIDEKLGQRLMEGEFTLKVSAGSDGREGSLIEALASNLSQFDSQYNWFAPADKQSHQLALTPPEIAALWHLPTEDLRTPGIDWATSRTAALPSLLLHNEGVLIGANTYRGKTQSIRLAYPDRASHVNIVGKSGFGKSTLLHNLAHQDIAHGHSVMVVDPHGDLVRDILQHSIPRSREKDVVIFDVLDADYPVGLNLLSVPPGVSSDTVAQQAIGVIKKIYADQWSETRMQDAMYAAIRALVAIPGSTIMDIPRLFNNEAYRQWVMAQVNDPVVIEFWQDEYDRRSPSQQQQIAGPINTRLRAFYRDPGMRRIICQPRSLSFRGLMDRGKILLASLGGIGKIEAGTLGTLLVSKLQMGAMSRAESGQRRMVYAYIDEVQNFTTTSLPEVFSEARKYGLSLVVANQYLSQLQGETLDAVLGNVGVTIGFQVGVKDARVLRDIMQPFDSADLMRLSKYTTVTKMQVGGQSLEAFSMTTPPPVQEIDDPDWVAWLRQQSRKRYGLPAAEIDAELSRRYSDQKPDDEPTGQSPTATQDLYTADLPAADRHAGDIDLDDIFE